MNSREGKRATWDVNALSDLDDDELVGHLGDLDGTLDDGSRRLAELDTESHGRRLQESSMQVNWVDSGNMTSVKDQGRCGSCVAFAVTSVAEGMKSIQSGEAPVRLSEQHEVDCASIYVSADMFDGTNYGNYGCQGGWSYKYFDFQIGEGVIEYDDYKPYTATDETCEHDDADVAFKPVSKGQITSNVYDVIDRLQQGPMAISLSAGNDVFRSYSSGIIDLEDGCPTRTDHCVTLVGYGVDTTTTVVEGGVTEETTETCSKASRRERKAKSCDG